MPAQCCTQENVLTKSSSYEDRPQKKPHTGHYPRTLTRQEATGCEAAEPELLPPAVPSRPLPSFIYAAFASCVVWLLLKFRWTPPPFAPSAAPNPEPRRAQMLLERRKREAEGGGTEVNQHRDKEPSPTHETQPEPAEDWRLQMLLERRKREAERAHHNPSIVLTFSGPTRVGVVPSAENRKRVCADISEDEDTFCKPLPFSFSAPSPVSRCGSVERCCSLPKKQISAFFDDCPGSRCTSPCSSDRAWDDSETDVERTSTSTSSDRPTRSRSSSSTGWESITGDESDEELEECTAVMYLLFEQD
ncbi:hypothetical protein K438DRAFT_1927712 [Mycena galopus ATCC 62051]|nr:hypothetical protein K438DRAFT_1927712 [Mycena galopus ATCC 62051]